MTRYELTIPGKPQTWQRSGGRGRRYKPKKMRDYQKRVEDYAFGMGVRPPIDKKTPVRFVAALHYADKRWRDLDNGVKTIADALQEFAYHDDSQITELIARKRIGQPKAKAVICAESMGSLTDPAHIASRNEELEQVLHFAEGHGYEIAADLLRHLIIRDQ